MNLGEFRKQTKDLPDDTQIVMDEGTLDFYEISIRHILSPVLEHSYAVTLEMGQPINSDLDMEHRIDAVIEYYGPEN